MFGLLGPNAEPDRLRRVLGYLPQEFGLYPSLSAEVTLDHFVVRFETPPGLQAHSTADATTEHFAEWLGRQTWREGGLEVGREIRLR